jgi:hypothetical protein
LLTSFEGALSPAPLVDVWAADLYVKAGLEDSKAALLVLIGALTDGRKVVLAVESGQQESKESWGVVLRDLRPRGLKPWRCTMADGHLGIWAALAEQQQPRSPNRRPPPDSIFTPLDKTSKRDSEWMFPPISIFPATWYFSRPQPRVILSLLLQL